MLLLCNYLVQVFGRSLELERELIKVLDESKEFPSWGTRKLGESILLQI
jgi:hypothetical protein